MKHSNHDTTSNNNTMRHLCLTRCFVVYSALCGLSLIAVAFYDAASTNTTAILPPIQPLLQDLSRLVLPERLSFCSVLELFTNESEPSQAMVISRHEEKQSPPWIAASFDPDRSTEENFTALKDAGQQQQSLPLSSFVPDSLFVGRFTTERRQLDYSYHGIYTAARQELQDKILSSMLDKAKTSQFACRSTGDNNNNPPQQHQWAIFTAGVMGAGKTHTLELLGKRQRFPLSTFVWVDPDRIRQCLPEFDYLVQYDAATAGDRTRKEAGMLSEILTLAALAGGQSVLVDGSLRDVEWFKDYFEQLRQNYPGIQIAIFHVTAPRQAVLERAASRARVTGRVVPTSLLEETMEQVPKSVSVLKTKADFFVEFHNDGDGDDVKIVQPEYLDWQGFTRQWAPLCEESSVVNIMT